MLRVMLLAGVAVAVNAVGTGVDDGGRDVEVGERPRRVDLLPAVVVLLPDKAGADAEVGDHRALDEERGFVRE
jgi:hypothetical protein